MELFPSDPTFSSANFAIDLPDLSETLVETARLTESEEDDNLSALRNIIANDPTATAEILEHINTVNYGLRRIKNVEHAVVLLGFDQLYRQIMAAGLVGFEDEFDSERQVAIFRQIVRRSLATASFANILSKQVRLTTSDLCFTGGILHAIGQIVLLYNDPFVYEKLWYDQGDLCQPSQRKEESIYGTTYPDVGAQALLRWELPNILAFAVGHHQNPPRLTNHRTVEKLVLTICTAWGWANNLVRDHNPTVPRFRSNTAAAQALERLARSQDYDKDSLKSFLRGKTDTVDTYVNRIVSWND